MMKSLIFASAFLVFLHATPGRMAVADTGHGAGFVVAVGGGSHEDEALRDECFDLIRIFDQTNTDNAQAKRLRESAERNCTDASFTDVYSGWDQIRQALTMINAY